MKPKISKELGQKIAAFVLFGGAVIFGYTKYFLNPTLGSIKADTKKIEELSGRVDELERRAKRRDKLLAEIAQAEATWATLKTRLPEKEDLPSILKTMDKISRKFRIQLGNISPMAVGGGDLYYEIPFGITLTGSYHDLAMFLEALGKTDRIFHARELNLSGSGPTQTAPWTSLGGNLALVTFQYKGS